MKTVTLYTDGACSGNPGPGGWGAILIFGGHKKELSGGEKSTTNNRMELTAVIRGLEALKESCVVELYSDSKYVIDALEKGWARGWRARGWVKADKKPALNPDLWGRLLELCDTHTVKLHWVKGHADNPYNNRCDELAVGEAEAEVPGPLTQSAASAAYKRFAQQNLVMGANSFRPHVENQKGPPRAKPVGRARGTPTIRTTTAAMSWRWVPGPLTQSAASNETRRRQCLRRAFYSASSRSSCSRWSRKARLI